MKVKCLHKIFIFLCALAVTGMVGVQNVKAQSCSAEGSIGISVDPPNIDVATSSIKYEIRVSNQSFFTDAGGAKLNIAATVFPGTVTVIPACKLNGSCTSKYGQDEIVAFDEFAALDCEGLGQAAGFVSCSQNAAGDVIMTVSATVDIGAASNVVIGNLYFTPSAPVPASDNVTGRFWVRAETGANDLQVNPPNPAFCPGEETGGAEGSTSALFPAICGDDILGNTTNPTGDVETCDPPESPGDNGTPPYNECRQAGLDNSCQADGACAITGDNCDNVCIAGVCSIDGADCSAAPCSTTNVCGPDNLCTLSGDPCVDACPLFQVGFCTVVEYDYACTYCGDGLLRPDAPVPSGPTSPAPNFTGFEECDNGASNSDLPGDATTCRTWCAPAICGDGITDTDLGETCDPPGQPGDPNDPNSNVCRGDCTFCGDGVWDQAVEECDPNDPTSIPADANCSATCEIVRECGDSIVGNTPGETCDPPGQPGDPNDPNSNVCRGDCTFCGDGVWDQAVEECDPNDPTSIPPDANCSDTCELVRVCGDSIVGNTPGETCDPPGQPGDPNDPNSNVCRDDCTFCGDGVWDQAVEECDPNDPNSIPADANCSATCELVRVCGDSIIGNTPGETCDPPGQPGDPNDPNSNVCRDDCTFCGDGVWDQAVEECDPNDPNSIPADANCSATCELVRECGDSIIGNTPGETCDPPGQPGDPNDPNSNVCRGDCTFCGDGVWDQAVEECDPNDPNSIPADANCSATCEIVRVCGDSIIGNTPGETCDPPGQPGDPNDPNSNVCRDDCTFCGDGVWDQAVEECDPNDPNSIPADANCSATCELVRECGDSIIGNSPGETCDPPGQPGDPNDPNSNVCRGDCTYCGDGVWDQPEEQCDPNDPNSIPADANCSATCELVRVCGDSIVGNTPGETCDPPGQPGDPNDPNSNVCRGDCTFCGDGVWDQPEEQCDPNDPNSIPADANCSATCELVRVCGDSIIGNTPGETCDPPGQPGDPNDPNSNVCRDDCTYCGDGVWDQAVEECDPNDPNSIPADANCSATCELVRVCGDSIIGNTPGETCDPPGQPGDPNDPNSNVCRGDCTYCGDGVWDQPEEQCDPNDPNSIPADANCSATCELVRECGDSIIGNSPGETCDPPGQPGDPNDPNSNVCRDDCTYCGDGVWDQPEEQCDPNDPNSIPADANCSATCELVRECGDSIIGNTPGETCDPPGQPGDPNDPNSNVCRDDCTYCGDGVWDQPEEQCDPNDPNSIPADANCSATCELVRECGDSIIGNTPGETCDPPGQPGDPNDPNSNVCRGDCTFCGDGVWDQAVEECDPNDPNSIPADANCSATCELVRECGDSIIGNTPGETCDPPGQPGDPNDPNSNVCRGDCTYCGDGLPNGGEECDDGNDIETDGCDNQCLRPLCEVDIEKEVNCGDGWVDDCTTFDGELVQVRYVVTNQGGTDLVECSIGESNPAIGTGVGPFDLNVADGTVIIPAGPDVVCSDNADGLEPDTANIECTCAGDPPAPPGLVTDEDQANFDCINCEIDIDKQVGATGGPYGDTYTTVDHQLVGYSFTISNTGRDDLSDCVLNDPMLNIVDMPVLSDDLVEIPNQQCEDGTNGANAIEGPNTATVSCSVCAGEDVDPTAPDSPYSAEDTAELDCLTPDMSAAKACEMQDDGSFTYTFTINNPGETDLDCVVYDTLVPGECGEPTGSDGDAITEVWVPMGVEPTTTMVEGVAISETSCNEATVACTVLSPVSNGILVPEMDECNPDTNLCVWSGEPCAIGAEPCGPKVLYEDVNAECEVPQGCWTHTPGFWGGKRWVTDFVLGDDGVESCGITLYDTDEMSNTSATEDMCFGGKDTKGAGYYPQQTQLIRQCTAAQLNMKASLLQEGSCEGYTVQGGLFAGAKIGEVLASCCDDLCTSGASGSEISSSGCIEAIDEFNNSDDTLDWDHCYLSPTDSCGADNCNKSGQSNNRFLPCREFLGTNSCNSSAAAPVSSGKKRK